MRAPEEGPAPALLILASQSPRRREILAAAGFSFTVQAPQVLEIRNPSESAEEYVIRLAREKAYAVPAPDGSIVLGADTIVTCDGQILEKPRDHADAHRMLELLSGHEHEVLTGICLRHSSQILVDYSRTKVRFAGLSKEEIEKYVRSGEPMDKAGAYAIQGLASKFIERIEGCYFNVVGLPISLVYRGLKTLGYY